MSITHTLNNQLLLTGIGQRTLRVDFQFDGSFDAHYASEPMHGTGAAVEFNAEEQRQVQLAVNAAIDEVKASFGPRRRLAIPAGDNHPELLAYFDDHGELLHATTPSGATVALKQSTLDTVEALIHDRHDLFD